MKDDEFLDDAIDDAKDKAHTSRSILEALKYQRIADWLLELQVRRQYCPLLCRVGWHRWVTCEGRRVCVRCGCKG